MTEKEARTKIGSDAVTFAARVVLRSGVVLSILSAVADMVHYSFTFGNFTFIALLSCSAGFFWALGDSEQKAGKP